LVGIAISLLGAFTLSISAEFVTANVPMPDILLEIIGWHWP
jgi:hypothetical protein